MAAPTSSSSGEQQYSFKWNGFHSSILNSLRHLRDQEDFVDVTLACDTRSYTAHKVVLSACSPYFRKLLKVNVSNELLLLYLIELISREAEYYTFLLHIYKIIFFTFIINME